MIRNIALCSLGCVLGVCSALGQSANPSADFTVSQLTAIPGKTLPPGHYTIHVVDHLADRYVLRVEGNGGQVDTQFLGIPDPRLPSGTQGMVRWSDPANGAAYLRGWHFDSLPTGLEFAYPKADAVAVAKANHAQVPAIDPVSQGLPADNNLTKRQMQIITLWLLTPTRVGPNAPAGISAKHFQDVASLTPPPAIRRLPHTASDLPWVWLAGGITLLFGFGLRGRRLREERLGQSRSYTR
jgi:hypothetical protein